MKVIIVDYNIGNIQSIKNVLLKLGSFDVKLSSKKEEILKADAIILPGVGAYENAMNELIKRDLPNILEQYVSLNKPLLGICLGMQLLFEKSSEFGETKGLGFIDGIVENFPNSVNDKIPHISWNKIYSKTISWQNTILKNVSYKDHFYFVHSYICKPKDTNIILSKTEYGGVEFCSSIKNNNIYACQFHPEKSANSGIKVMKNFIELIKESI